MSIKKSQMSEHEIHGRICQLAAETMVKNKEIEELEKMLEAMKPPDLGVSVSDGLGIEGEMK